MLSLSLSPFLSVSFRFERAINRIAAIEKAAGIDLADADSEITKETLNQFVEGVKEKNLLTNVMHAVRDEIPLVHAALVGERDVFMAEAIASSPGMNMVGVVGMAHMEGMENHLTQQKGFRVVKRNCPAFKPTRKPALVSSATPNTVSTDGSPLSGGAGAGAAGVGSGLGRPVLTNDPFAKLGDIPILSLPK
jgi:hypothetical protein